MVEILDSIAGTRVERIHDLSAPKGVRGRNSDNTKVLKELFWSPTISLRKGLETTYEWIESQLEKKDR
jgi:nucleoside-diphosphate-sugar epimerase